MAAASRSRSSSKDHPLKLINKVFSVCLVLLGLFIARAALMGTPDLEDLEYWEGQVSSIETESVMVAKNSNTYLRVALDGAERVFYIHPKGLDIDEIAKALAVGTPISAWVEHHARQILAGTPLARGRTEAWQVIVQQESGATASPLLPYANAASRRRKDRAGWGLAAGAAFLVGAWGLSQWRRELLKG